MKHIKHDMHWAKNIICLEDERLQKQIFSGELVLGKNKAAFGTLPSRNLKSLKLSTGNWENI